MHLIYIPDWTSSDSRPDHSFLKQLAPVRLPSPPIHTRLLIPWLTRFRAALSLPERSRKSLQRALPITVPPWKLNCTNHKVCKSYCTEPRISLTGFRCRGMQIQYIQYTVNSFINYSSTALNALRRTVFTTHLFMAAYFSLHIFGFMMKRFAQHLYRHLFNDFTFSFRNGFWFRLDLQHLIPTPTYKNHITKVYMDSAVTFQAPIDGQKVNVQVVQYRTLHDNACKFIILPSRRICKLLKWLCE